MNATTGIIIQARMQSTRMPKKILLPFHQKKGILEWQIKRMKQVVDQNKIVVATTVENADDPIVNLCEELDINCYRGSEENVLNRFITCAEEFGFNEIIRVCSDNVFLDLQRLNFLLNLSEEMRLNNDYVSYSVNETPGIKTHYGIWTEWVKLTALKKVADLTKEKLYIEHVTNFIYANKNVFNCHFYDIDFSKKPKFRLTTDTPDDFILQQAIFKKLMDEHGLDFTTNHIFDFLTEHPEHLKIMDEQIQLNGK